MYLECLVWPRLSQAPEPLAVSQHRSLGHNIVHNPGTLVITRKLRVLHVVSAGNCQSPCPGRVKHRKAGCASQVGALCAARRRWFPGAAMGEEYPLILVCTGELPASGCCAGGVVFTVRITPECCLPAHRRLYNRGSVVMDRTNPAKKNFFCRGTGMITPNITALSLSGCGGCIRCCGWVACSSVCLQSFTP